MSSNAITELDLISALQSMGVIRKLSGFNFSVIKDTDAHNSNSLSTAESKETEKDDNDRSNIPKKFEKSESLRLIRYLVDGLLNIHIRGSSPVSRYINFVLPSLFRFLNDSNSDVRISADENLNKLIKYLRISMNHLILFELFMELKRNFNLRSVSVVLEKFATLSRQIRLTKRRFYMVNILPVLINICQEENETVYENLVDHFSQIAHELFFYATEKELRHFLRVLVVRLSSENGFVRRSIAQILVITCQSSRAPSALLRNLFQIVLHEMDRVESTISSATDKSQMASINHFRVGLLNTLRYLTIAWIESAKIMSCLPKMAFYSDSAVHRMSSLDEQLSGMTELNLPESATISSVFSSPVKSPFGISHSDDKLWSRTFLTCLDQATSSSSIIVITAALELLVQLLLSGLPGQLFILDWLNISTSTSTSLSTNDFNDDQGHTINESTNLNQTTYDGDYLGEVEDMELIHAPNFQNSSLVRSFSDEEFVDEFKSCTSLNTPRSLTSPVQSVISDSDVQLHREQLEFVRQKLATDKRHKQMDLVMNDDDVGGDRQAVAGDVCSQSDFSIVDRMSSGDLCKNANEQGDVCDLDQSKSHSMTLRELLVRLVQSDACTIRNCDWLIPFIILSFDLMPPATSDAFDWPKPRNGLPRTSTQLLAIYCLTYLAQYNSCEFFAPLKGFKCCLSTDIEWTQVRWPSPVEIMLAFPNRNTDPQIHGQICLLLGNLIGSYFMHQTFYDWTNVNDESVVVLSSNHKPSLDWIPIRRVFDHLMSNMTDEVSGITLRLALIGLRQCANVLLNSLHNSFHDTRLDKYDDHLGDNSNAISVGKFFRALNRILISSARHSYRLVRREVLFLIRELDWTTIDYFERMKQTKTKFSNSSQFLVRPTRLLDVTWLEVWRLLCDPDVELRDQAGQTLIALSSNLTSGFQGQIGSHSMDVILHRHLARRLHFWLPNPYSQTKSIISGHHLVCALSSSTLPVCLSALGTEMDAGPVGTQTCQTVSSNMLYLEQNSPNASDVGIVRLFQNLMAALMELPVSAISNDDRHLFHSLIHILNQLVGHPHMINYLQLWHDDLTSDSRNDSVVENPVQHKRSRLALLSWHCLSILSSCSIASTDLELHAMLVTLCTGCTMRWSLFTLTNAQSDNDSHQKAPHSSQSHIRFALALLQHLMRIFSILWSVIESIPLSIFVQYSSTVGANETPTMNTFLHTLAQFAQASILFPVSPPPVSSFQKTSMHADSAERKHHRPNISASNNLPHYSQLYDTIKLSYEAFKISPDLIGNQDRVMYLLQTCLTSLGRLLEVLCYADVAQYMDELFVYLNSFYYWQSGPCLELSTQLLRIFAGTNLNSQWDQQLTKLYQNIFNPSRVKMTGEDDCTANAEQTHFAWPIKVEMLHTPITNWIRFARQWRIPLILSSNVGGERIPTLPNFHTSVSSNSPNPIPAPNSGGKPEIEHFFKRLELIVLRGMETFKWIDCIQSQVAILDLLIHLIYLRMNYNQLDTELKFLANVLHHCESLSSEIQRLDTSVHRMHQTRTNYHATSKRQSNNYHANSGWANQGMTNTMGNVSNQLVMGLAAQMQTPLFVNMDNNVTLKEQHQRLVNAVFRFVIILTYRASSQTKVTGEEGCSIKNVDELNVNRMRIVELSQVIHLAESLTAEINDPTSVILTALAPVVTDLFVIQRSLTSGHHHHYRLQQQHSNVAVCSDLSHEPTKKVHHEQIDAHRESIFSFLLRRLAYFPASYDQISLVLEEAMLYRNHDDCHDNNYSKNIEADTSSSVQSTTVCLAAMDYKKYANVKSCGLTLESCISQTLQTILFHLNAGTSHIRTRSDFAALLRLLDHLVLAIGQYVSSSATPDVDENPVTIRTYIAKIEKVIYCVTNPKYLLISADEDDLDHFIQWAVMQVSLGRLTNQLYAFVYANNFRQAGEKCSASSPLEQASLFANMEQRLSHFLCVLQLIAQSICIALVRYPFLVNNLPTLWFDQSAKSTMFQLLVHLCMMHLLTLLGMTDTTFNLGNNGILKPDFINQMIGVIQQIHGRLNALTRFEPLVYSIWCKLLSALAIQLPQLLDCVQSLLSACLVAQSSHNTSIGCDLATRASTIYLVQTGLTLKNGDNAYLQLQRVSQLLLTDIDTNTGQDEYSGTVDRFQLLVQMWQCGDPVMTSYIDHVFNHPTTSCHLLRCLTKYYMWLSPSQMRFVLFNVIGKLHSSTVFEQLDFLWDVFLAPLSNAALDDSGDGCHSIQYSFPLTLRLLATNRAYELLESCIEDDSLASSKLVDLVNRLTATRTCLNYSKLKKLLGQLVDKRRLDDQPRGRVEEYDEFDVELAVRHDNFSTLTHKWLLDSVKLLLTQPNLMLNMNAIRLLDKLCLAYYPTGTDELANQIALVFRQSRCFDTSPRLFQFALSVGASHSNASELAGTIQTASITPQTNSLFYVTQQCLFEAIHHVIDHPKEILSRSVDSNANSWVQSYLTGLIGGLLEYLRVLPHLAQTNVIPIELDNVALSFLRLLIQFILIWSHNHSQFIHTRAFQLTIPMRVFSLSPHILQYTFRLLNHVLQTAAHHFAKGIDVFSGQGEDILFEMLVFISFVDQYASLSHVATHWLENWQGLWNEKYQPIRFRLITNLLIPHNPSLVSRLSNAQPPIASQLIAYCCELLEALGSVVISQDYDDQRESHGCYPYLFKNGFIKPNHLFGKCRLQRSQLNTLNGCQTEIESQLICATLAILRLIRTLDLKGTNQNTSSNQLTNQSFLLMDRCRLENLSLVNLDLDVVSAIVATVNAVGWLHRREFERIWMAYLELLETNKNALVSLNQQSHLTGVLGFSNSEEIIERNRTIDLGLLGLTKILSDVFLTPQPGDCLYSQFGYYSRLGTAHFLHSKLGQKLVKLSNLIGQSLYDLQKVDWLSHNPNEHAIANLQNRFVEEEACLSHTLAEFNMEHVGTNPRLHSGFPSRFSVDWLLKRLTRKDRDSKSVSPSPPNHPTNDNYDHLLFSCLQSLQLLYHSALTTPDSLKANYGRHMKDTNSSPNKASFYKSMRLKPQKSGGDKQMLAGWMSNLSFGVWQSTLRSAIQLSDLFTSHEQYIWLNDQLKDAFDQLPDWSDFQLPLHGHLTLGLGRCTAVLELVSNTPQQDDSCMPIQSESNLSVVVKQTLNALQSHLISVQDLALHSSLYLLHSALVIRSQPHQQQLQQRSPPTGSTELNGLYSHLCIYLESQMLAIFNYSVSNPVYSNPSLDHDQITNSPGVVSATHTPTTNGVTRSSTPVVAQTGSSATSGVSKESSGLKRFMSAMLRPGMANKVATNVPINNVPTRLHAMANTSPSVSSNCIQCNVNDQMEQHQLVVLSAAFFLVEHFSGPPVCPTQIDSGQVEMLSTLQANLFELGPSMLSDQHHRHWITTYSSSGTTSELNYSIWIHTCWCQGMERLILCGRMSKGAIASLQKLCLNRIRSCRSSQLSWPVMRLLITCMYVSLGLVTSSIQHFVRGCRSPRPSDAKDEPLPDSVTTDLNTVLGLIQESMNCFWDRLRGILSSSSPSNLWSWICHNEAHLIGQLLPSLNYDLNQALVGLLNLYPIGPSQLDVIGQSSLDGTVVNMFNSMLVNKALGEFARADHAYPDLVAFNLVRLFEQVMMTEDGCSLIRQWILLSFPTLLNRQPPALAMWSCTVCLLAATTKSWIRPAIFLCPCPILSRDYSSTYLHYLEQLQFSQFNPNLGRLLSLATFDFVSDCGLLKPLHPSTSPAAIQRHTDRCRFLQLLREHSDVCNVETRSIFKRLYRIVSSEVGVAQ